MRYYVESDGHLYLVRRGALWDLPTAEQIPFPFDEVAPLPTSEEVAFCIPRLPAHPGEWPSKDVVASDPGVSELAREAVHATMPRVVVEGLCMNATRKSRVQQFSSAVARRPRGPLRPAATRRRCAGGRARSIRRVG